MEITAINSDAIKEFSKPLKPLFKEIEQEDAALKSKQIKDREKISKELKEAKDICKQLNSQSLSQANEIKEILESNLSTDLVEIYLKAQEQAQDDEYGIETALREGLHL